MANIIGPDVSFYQDDPQTPNGIDFSSMRTVTDFVIIRAGQNLWVDTDFKANWREAKLVSLARGSYWFYDSRADPKKQAELWVQQFEGDLGELPMFADLEERYAGSYQGWKNWYIFLERLKVLVPKKEIGIYTAYYYWREFAPNATTEVANLEYFHQYPLWIANYGATAPAVPKPWSASEWLLWQYTDNGDGKPYGVESLNIDLNYFNGDVTAFRKRFNIPYLPPPPPPITPPPVVVNPPPPPPALAQLRVTTADLIVRQGPGLTFLAIGHLALGDIVEQLSVSPDQAWKDVRKLDGSIAGWCSSAGLVSVDGSTPPIPELPPTPPVPNYDNKKWFRVTASALNIRATPSGTGTIVGALLKDDTVPVVNESDPNWLQIERIDGLKGWCSRTYLAALGTPRPASIRQSLYTGVTYLRNDLKVPRLNALHIMVIDLLSTNLEFLVTPSTGTAGIICSRTTAKFLDDFKLHIAINGDGFSSLDPSAAACATGSSPLKVNGFAASRGTVYSPQKNIQPEIYISSTNQMTVETPPATVFNAIAGDRLVVDKGLAVKNLPAASPNPRTALGLNQSGRWLSLFVIDGYQTGYSEGVTFPELASLMISYGIYTGVNMDGGNSTSMVIRGVDGNARLVNSPVDLNIPGRQRPVANHLGLFIKK